MGFKVCVVAVSYSTGIPSSSANIEWTRHPTLVPLAARKQACMRGRTSVGRKPPACLKEEPQSLGSKPDPGKLGWPHGVI